MGWRAWGAGGGRVLWPSRQASWMACLALYSSRAATDMAGCRWSGGFREPWVGLLDNVMASTLPSPRGISCNPASEQGPFEMSCSSAPERVLAQATADVQDRRGYHHCMEKF